jgi:hypothetical protein
MFRPAFYFQTNLKKLEYTKNAIRRSKFKFIEINFRDFKMNCIFMETYIRGSTVTVST